MPNGIKTRVELTIGFVSAEPFYQANDTSAIRFFDGHYIPNMDNIKSFNQTFLFGLCANGKVIADKYSGAVDVSFIVE
ncbi:TPA: hypothetical protein SMQ42_001005 [Proteus mirabilis]|nr:hypothetical protein [Proteus mirabilis]